MEVRALEGLARPGPNAVTKVVDSLWRPVVKKLEHHLAHLLAADRSEPDGKHTGWDRDLD